MDFIFFILKDSFDKLDLEKTAHLAPCLQPPTEKKNKLPAKSKALLYLPHMQVGRAG